MTFASYQKKNKHIVKSLRSFPPIVHLGMVAFIVLIAVMSLNFEVFRVIRVGDLLIIFFAYLVGVNWYGQHMLEEGYRNGLREATEAAKQKRK